MNICITSHDMEPRYICGIKKVSATLAKEWIQEHNVYFLAFQPLDNLVNEISGIPQYHLPEPNDIASKKNLKFLIDFIREKEIDIILHQHSDIEPFTELCAKAKKETGVKLIATRHFAITYSNDAISNSFFIKDRLQISPIKWIKDFAFLIKFHLIKKRNNLRRDNHMFRFLIKNSDKIVLLCKSHITDFNKQLKLDYAEQNKICAISNPIEICEPSNFIKKKTVLWCGRIEFGVKRTDRIIDIWSTVSHKHPEWELVIMGNGDIDFFKRIAERKGAQNITFTGHCDPFEYYRQGSILCMTSSTEGLPMVILEAQMYGCIPVAYNSFSSLDEIITNGVNGYKIPAFNRNKFAEQLEWLMDNETERIRMARICQQSVKRFDTKIIARQWIELFQDVLKDT